MRFQARTDSEKVNCEDGVGLGATMLQVHTDAVLRHFENLIFGENVEIRRELHFPENPRMADVQEIFIAHSDSTTLER